MVGGIKSSHWFCEVVFVEACFDVSRALGRPYAEMTLRKAAWIKKTYIDIPESERPNVDFPTDKEIPPCFVEIEAYMQKLLLRGSASAEVATMITRFRRLDGRRMLLDEFYAVFEGVGVCGTSGACSV